MPAYLPYYGYCGLSVWMWKSMRLAARYTRFVQQANFVWFLSILFLINFHSFHSTTKKNSIRHFRCFRKQIKFYFFCCYCCGWWWRLLLNRSRSIEYTWHDRQPINTPQHVSYMHAESHRICLKNSNSRRRLMQLTEEKTGEFWCSRQMSTI